MRRVFDLDVLACPRCGGRLRVIATGECGRHLLPQFKGIRIGRPEPFYFDPQFWEP